MSDENTFFVFIESLPTELTISIVFLILLCFCCCAKDFIICCWRERRASQRIKKLERLKKETEEIEIVRSIEKDIENNLQYPRSISKKSKYNTRDEVGVLV